MYDLNAIKECLDTKNIGKTIIQFDELKSTNLKAKSIFSTCPDGTVILTENQIHCKARFGREWCSYPDKNIYLSIILKPKNGSHIISKYETISSAAVCKSISYLYNSLDCKVKWPNDIMARDKRISMVHCENVKLKNKAEGIIISIGINANLDINDFEDELKRIATSIKIETNNKCDREVLIGCILSNFEKYNNELTSSGKITKSIHLCTNSSLIIGRNIKVTRLGKKTIRKVFVQDMDCDGNLVVKNDKGNEEIINSGEVTVKYDENA